MIGCIGGEDDSSVSDYCVAPECLTDTTLPDAIDHCLTVDTSAHSVDGECPTSADNPYGPMPDWCMSNVTTLSRAFEGRSHFNGDISGWDTGSATSMSFMFARAYYFNRSIGGWNTSAITSFELTFSGANSFDQPIGKWNTGASTSFEDMFFDAFSFNQPIAEWNTGASTSFESMFGHAYAFNQPIAGWNTSATASLHSGVDPFLNMFNGATLMLTPPNNCNLDGPPSSCDSTTTATTTTPTTTTSTTTTTTVIVCKAGEEWIAGNSCRDCPANHWSDDTFKTHRCQPHHSCNDTSNTYLLILGTQTSPAVCVVENEAPCADAFYRHDYIVNTSNIAKLRRHPYAKETLQNDTQKAIWDITHNVGNLSNSTMGFLANYIRNASRGHQTPPFDHTEFGELRAENWTDAFNFSLCIESRPCYYEGLVTTIPMTDTADNVCSPCSSVHEHTELGAQCPTSTRTAPQILGECTFPLYVFIDNERNTSACCLGPDLGHVGWSTGNESRPASLNNDSLWWWINGTSIYPDDYTPNGEDTSTDPNYCMYQNTRWNPSTTTTTRTTKTTTWNSKYCFNEAQNDTKSDSDKTLRRIAGCFLDVFSAHYGRDDTSGKQLCVGSGRCDFVCKNPNCKGVGLTLSMSPPSYDAFNKLSDLCKACETTTQTTSTVTVKETTPASGIKQKLRFTKRGRKIAYIVVSLVSTIAMVLVLALNRDCRHVRRRLRRRGDSINEKLALMNKPTHS